MNVREESILRLAQRRRDKLGAMSDEAFDELKLAVRENPEGFVDCDEDRAFLLLGRALKANDEARKNEEFLDDDAYERAHAKRMDRLVAACRDACELDPGCLDALTMTALLSGSEADDMLEELLRLEREAAPFQPAGSGASAWDDVFCRPRLRLRAAITRELLDTTRFRAAQEACSQLVELTPGDPLGARFTWALACARLEDETAFNALDAKFDRQGNAWSHIARILLMFKLDRMSAARRALRGFASLCEGGAYALLRPVYVDAYLPDRPSFVPGSFEEVTLAVHEADPVVVDTPDFISWASAQDGFLDEAQRYADSHDLDW